VEAASEPDAAPSDFLAINTHVHIPLTELLYETTRSSGAGGQHVNKNETAVALLFDCGQSTALSATERQRIQTKLAGRINSVGILRVESQESRSQLKNREEATRRFAQLLREALIVPKQRRKTKPSKASKERRLTAKKRDSDVKRNRRVDY
jgi:ribosome-associated protein